MSYSPNQTQSPALFGHPAGLFTLFFAEMWERFSYYGMRALLVFYMIKGFMQYSDGDAYTVYGAYTALVYMTPFFGGMLADRLIGQRRAVVLGGLLMAGGHLMMMVENSLAFFTALALLICGNGFFKPNISTIVGSLYPQGSPKREGGFTIFYIGINLGAAMSPLLCGYIGETYGRHWGFGLATIGMLVGVAVFVAPTLLTQVLIMLGAAAAAVGMFLYQPDNAICIGINILVGVLLLVSGAISMAALGRGGLPTEAGAPPDPERLRRPMLGPISGVWVVYLGTIVATGVFILLVSGFAPFTKDKRPITMIPDYLVNDLNSSDVVHGQLKALRGVVEEKRETAVDPIAEGLAKVHEDGKLNDQQHAALREAVDLAAAGQWESAQTKIEEVAEHFPKQPLRVVLAVVLKEASRPAGLVLLLSGLAAFVYLVVEMIRLDAVARHRMYVVLILTFFSMLFWAFFEQAGSSVNNFTDRNVDRVDEQSTITAEDVGKTIRIQPTQEQLGYHNGDQLFTLDVLDKLREEHGADPGFVIDWTVAEDNAAEDNQGMGIADRIHEIPATTCQSINPIFILLLGLPFTVLWAVMAKYRLEPSTPVKFALGLVQLGGGFAAFWYGAQIADQRGMVFLGWLLLGYLLQTTGELCLSPVGLAMITKLSPARLVSTVMGSWFLATAFSQFLAAIIAQFTGVTHGGNGEGSTIPVPKETVHVYGDVFGTIAISAAVSGAICLLLSPLLNYWMHSEVDSGA